MRKTRPRKKPGSPAPSGLSIVPREDHDELQPGDVVTLPDGGIAAIERIVGTDAYVVEWNKTIGRGPWIFPLSDLTPIS